jgi:hypothetical protein
MTAAEVVTLFSDETDPDTLLGWRASSTALRDLSAHTLAVEVIDPATNEIELDKTSGVLGADGTGSSNVNIAWTAVELAGLTADYAYRLRLTATSGSDVSVFKVNGRAGLGALPMLIVSDAPA